MDACNIGSQREQQKNEELLGGDFPQFARQREAGIHFRGESSRSRGGPPERTPFDPTQRKQAEEKIVDRARQGALEGSES